MAHDPTMRRAELLSLLGDLPPLDRPIRAERLWRDTRPHYHLEKWTLDLNGLEPVPAYVTLPLDARGPAPAVLYNHAHGSDYALGKDELLNGRSHLQAPPYAEALAREGVAALCIDHWVFGERATRTESAAFKQMLWEGRVLWGMMVYDSLRALDFLVERPEVDPARIGTLGLSMGSTMAWWVAALDTRVQVCVDLCCLTDYQALIDAGGLDGHGVYYYVPRLLKHFTSAEINALIAPRPHLGLAGDRDPLTPPAGLDRIDAALRDAYAAAGAPEAWRLLRYDCGHQETPGMRVEVIEWLRRWL
ncbi:MAG: alpha/beta hydrolase family protein [Chloroflexota bacterium]|nr:dienelactone hydrolase family protein [Anaerolineae bacterium]